ncbi:hypothetical protein RRG08_025663 [Elysia crispata]|uniref:Uncharacterized protein n=1 Tax=Elysia crispata TaxID=231223 RepID=A0AAE0YEN2_9GAST|nr:hypothetical protein RRG08_025663 [Elysia crispata]
MVSTKVIYIDCAYYTASVEAALLDEPLHDVTLGNTKGVKCPVNDQLNSEDAAPLEVRVACKTESPKS